MRNNATAGHDSKGYSVNLFKLTDTDDRFIFTADTVNTTALRISVMAGSRFRRRPQAGGGLRHPASR